MGKKKTHGEFSKEVFDLTNGEYMLLSRYINNKTKVLILHLKCGNVYPIRPDNFISNGNRCPKCDPSKQPKGLKKFIQELKDQYNNEYKVTVNTKYVNNSTPLEIEHNCNKCNHHRFLVSPNHILGKNPTGCPECNLIRQRKGLDALKKEVYDMYGNEYEVLGTEYTNNKGNIKMRHNCKACNCHVWMCNINNFTSKTHLTQCPICARGKQDSKDEREIREYIEKELGMETYNKEESVKILGNKDIDILLVGGIGFEYNGDYWHKEVENPDGVRGGRPIGYHRNKTKEAREKGITLYHIWERDWKKRPEDVKKFIKRTIEKYFDDK